MRAVAIATALRAVVRVAWEATGTPGSIETKVRAELKTY
jgi:hypothetical protein